MAAELNYLVDARHLDVKSMAVVGALPWLGATIGLVTGGTLNDLLAKKLGNALLAHKSIIGVGLLGAALCIVSASRATSATTAVTLIACASLLAFLTPQTCWVLVQDIVPPDRVGTAGGFVHFLANLAGIASPGLTGYIVQYGGGYGVAFASAAGLAALGATFVMLLIRGDHAPRDDGSSRVDARDYRQT